MEQLFLDKFDNVATSVDHRCSMTTSLGFNFLFCFEPLWSLDFLNKNHAFPSSKKWAQFFKKFKWIRSLSDVLVLICLISLYLAKNQFIQCLLFTNSHMTRFKLFEKNVRGLLLPNNPFPHPNLAFAPRDICRLSSQLELTRVLQDSHKPGSSIGWFFVLIWPASSWRRSISFKF